jgi:hypothetical protein
MMTTDVNQAASEADPRSASVPLSNWQPTITVEFANGLKAAAWLAEVEGFREQEEKLMLDGNYDALLPEHRVALSFLIANGEGIVCAVRKNGMDARLIKFTAEDLQSTLDSLHTTFRCEYGPKNSQKTNELIAQLFDASNT